MSQFPPRCILANASLALMILSLSAWAAGPEEPLGERGRRLPSPWTRVPMPNVIAVAANADAQARLEPPLSDDQKARIADLVPRWSTWSRMTAHFSSGLTTEEYRAAQQSFREMREQKVQALVKELENILKPPQFQQLRLIAAGIPLVSIQALANPEIAAIVGVSDDSQKKITAIVEASYKKEGALLRGVRNAQAAQEQRRKMTRERILEINKVLLDKEKALVQKAIKAAEGIQLYSPPSRRGQRAGSGGA